MFFLFLIMHFLYDVTFYVTGKIDVPVVRVMNYTSNLIVMSRSQGRSFRCDNIAFQLSKSEKVSLLDNYTNMRWKNISDARATFS